MSIVPDDGFARSSGTVTLPQRMPAGHGGSARAEALRARPPSTSTQTMSSAHEARTVCRWGAKERMVGSPLLSESMRPTSRPRGGSVEQHYALGRAPKQRPSGDG